MEEDGAMANSYNEPVTNLGTQLLDLPEELLHCILKLLSIVHKKRLRSACSSLRKAIDCQVRTSHTATKLCMIYHIPSAKLKRSNLFQFWYSDLLLSNSVG
jgi:hypothetical protein